MIYVWGILAAMGVTALLSASEMAFIAANRVRIRHLAENGNATAAPAPFKSVLRLRCFLVINMDPPTRGIPLNLS